MLRNRGSSLPSRRTKEKARRKILRAFSVTGIVFNPGSPCKRVSREEACQRDIMFMPTSWITKIVPPMMISTQTAAKAKAVLFQDWLELLFMCRK